MYNLLTEEYCRVHSAAKLAGIVKQAGGKVAVFNIDRSKRDEQAEACKS